MKVVCKLSFFCSKNCCFFEAGKVYELSDDVVTYCKTEGLVERFDGFETVSVSKEPEKKTKKKDVADVQLDLNVEAGA